MKVTDELDTWAAGARGRSWETVYRADVAKVWSGVAWEKGTEIAVTFGDSPDQARQRLARELRA